MGRVTDWFAGEETFADIVKELPRTVARLKKLADKLDDEADVHTEAAAVAYGKAKRIRIEAGRAAIAAERLQAVK